MLSVNPTYEEKVSESLFFCDYAEPDPFPGTQYTIELVPFVAPQEWQGQYSRHEVSGRQAGDEAPPQVATKWLVTLHLAASRNEVGELGAEYSRLTRMLGETPTLDLQSFSPVPTEVENNSILGPLWLAETRRAVADPSSVTEYPLARLLHRARLVVGCDGDPSPLLPETRLTGTWTTEPLV